MTPSYHPPLELLFDHAAGSLDPATALVIATHLELCPQCRGEAGTFEAVGGEMLETMTPAGLAPDALDRMMRLIEAEPPPMAQPAPAGASDPILGLLPASIQSLGETALKTTKWRSLAPGVRALDLPVPAAAGGAAQLLWIAAGRGVPRHTHAGNELTLVLNGVFGDEHGRFVKGDLQITNPAVTHRPKAEPGEVCVVLAVTDAPLRLTGLLGLIQRALGY